MTEQPKPAEEKSGQTGGDQEQPTEEERIKEILERARQNVKRLAEKELAGEKVSRELLNLRLRAADGS
ncbi:MAG: hypothetical protein HY290_19990 [Planctomycetia bacterium]|nr:hypothetical protein [Planctomycetia bacterium]